MMIAIVLLIIIPWGSPSIQGTHLADDELDQEQIIGNIYSDVYDGVMVAQTFKPSKTTITRIQLFLKRNGEPNSNFTFILTKDRNGPYLFTMNLSTHSVPLNEREWIEFNFEDISVNVDETYYFILTMNDGDIFNNIRWYGSDTDSYLRGYKLHSNDQGETWVQELLRDCAFRVYGTSSFDLEILYMVGGSGSKIDYGIKNIGVQEINNLIVQFDLYDGIGIMLTGKHYAKVINVSIPPGESFQDFFYPVFGIGAYPRATLRVATESISYKEIKRDIIFLLPYIYIKPQ
jgi:hypothetical protein